MECLVDNSLIQPVDRIAELEAKVGVLAKEVAALHRLLGERHVWPPEWGLTGPEHKALSALYVAAGRVLSKELLARQLGWKSTSIPVVISTLRTRLPMGLGITHRSGHGYALTPKSMARLVVVAGSPLDFNNSPA